MTSNKNFCSVNSTNCCLHITLATVWDYKGKFFFGGGELPTSSTTFHSLAIDATCFGVNVSPSGFTSTHSEDIKTNACYKNILEYRVHQNNLTIFRSLW